MKLIVGLGNPGSEFSETRHNVGFMLLEKLASYLKLKFEKKIFNGECVINDEFILLKPLTFINNSGNCIKLFAEKYNIKKEKIIIVYDDISLPLGTIRLRERGSSGGHNGVRNIINVFETQFLKRLRIGIGQNKNISFREWVLQKITIKEKKEIEKVFEKIIEGLENWLFEKKNFSQLMNEYNKKTIIN